MTAQLERLIEDSNQLQTYITKVQKKGRTDLVPKLNQKLYFLDQTIAEFRQQLQ
jgi:hypothetical protein